LTSIPHNLDLIGLDWLIEEVETITDHIDDVGIVEFCENNRYLPAGLTSQPGFINFRDVNPYVIEILECFEMDSPIREVNIMKGVQMTYTVSVLECILFYYMCYLKTYPCMLTSADKELVQQRVDNNIIPMLQQSNFEHIIQSHDEGNQRKTGKNKGMLQFEGGGFLLPLGAVNANKMRSHSILLNLKDEIEAWADTVGKDGDPDKLTDSRCDAFTDDRKILRGSTPLTYPSRTHKRYMEGDQRRFNVVCRKCNFAQPIDWTHKTETGERVRSFSWEMDRGSLVFDSVGWHCSACGHKHYNHEKDVLMSLDEGAHWKSQARAKNPQIRSYHLPAFLSPMKAWANCVSDFLDCYDPIAEKVVDVPAYQVFYNNILGMPFEVLGERVSFTHVSGHRRPCYRLGQIPNRYAVQWSGSPILFVTCQVDVHLKNLAVAVMGWTRDAKCYVIDYKRVEDEDCTRPESPAWNEVRDIIENRVYKADDGREYSVFATLIDSAYSNDTIVDFCSDYGGWVFPILGADRPAKAARIKEFSEFETTAGTVGFRIIVDHYKDRIAPVLRREWTEQGPQPRYHFNAPVDLSDGAIKELTAESKRKKVDKEKGITTYYWHRPSGRDNELWDLLVYGHAAVEIIACEICLEHFGLETVDWPQFWDYMAAQLDAPAG